MIRRRKQIRLSGYDYSQLGWYFVTMCTQDRKCIFGYIQSVGVDRCVDPIDRCVDPDLRVDPNPIMMMNDVGQMVNYWWREIPKKYANVKLDIYQIMPNHIHGIINIVDETHQCDGRTSGLNGRTHRSAPTVGTIIQWFKTMATNAYLQNMQQLHWPRFNKRIFQRNYYEHIIRNEIELFKIRQYIKYNPLFWKNDINYV